MPEMDFDIGKLLPPLPEIKKRRKRIQSQYSNQAVSYARVSSKEQQKGTSIDSQNDGIQKYITENDLKIRGDFGGVESAKETGRPRFNEMVRFLLKHEEIHHVVCFKTDRLSRNSMDMSILQMLGVTIHRAVDGKIISSNSSASEKFIHNIEVAQAEYYSDDLSEKVKLAKKKKLETGWLPGQAPIGYKNVPDKSAPERIIVDEKLAPMVLKLFELYASGTFTLDELAKRARREGFAYRKNGTLIPKKEILRILRNPFYDGRIKYNGEMYQGKHKPIVSKDLWNRVQDVLEGRGKKISQRKYDFLYSKLMSCGACGYAIIGERKKKLIVKDQKERTYIYYRCTGYSGGGKISPCFPYIREEDLDKQFGELLGRLQFKDGILEWMREVRDWGRSDQHRNRKESIKRLRKQHSELDTLIEKTHTEKMLHHDRSDFYDKMLSKYRESQAQCRDDMEANEKILQADMERDARFFDPFVNPSSLLKHFNNNGNRWLLKLIFKDIKLHDKEIKAEFHEVFNVLAKPGNVVSISKADEIEARRRALLNRHLIDIRNAATHEALELCVSNYREKIRNLNLGLAA